MTVPPVIRRFPYQLFYRNFMSRLLFLEKSILVSHCGGTDKPPIFGMIPPVVIQFRRPRIPEAAYARQSRSIRPSTMPMRRSAALAKVTS